MKHKNESMLLRNDLAFTSQFHYHFRLKNHKLTTKLYAVMTKQTKCRRCGTCCSKGGPALHDEDLELLRDGIPAYQDLVTIRKGEPAYSPLTDQVEPVRKELVKISGHGQSWTCLFYDPAHSACTIHSRRPLECRLLKCWDTSDIMAVIEKNTITRLDIIGEKDPMAAFICEHEKKCPYKKINSLQEDLSSSPRPSSLLKELTAIIREDLAIRERAVAQFQLSLPLELFYFGRPVFQVIRREGLNFFEKQGKIHIDYKNCCA